MPFFERVELSAEQKKDLASFLATEIFVALTERAPLERKWESLYTQWRAEVPEVQKDFPWPGAPNIEFPLTAMHADPVYADFMQTLHTPEDYWTPVATRKDRVPHASPLREFLRAVDRNFLKMREVNSRALLYQNILGTAIYKNHWIRERKVVRAYTPDGRVEHRTRIISQPSIESIPLQHFLLPAAAWEIDPDMPGGAQWVAHRFYLRRPEFLLRRNSDDRFRVYDREAADIVLRMEETPSDRLDEKIRESIKFKPGFEQKIELWEVWLRYDFNRDGTEEDLCVVFHAPSQQILRTTYLPYLHGKRPFYRTQYLPSFGFYGVGMAEADKWAQATLTDLINGALCNLMVANTRMYGVPLGSAMQPGEPIFPGKLWPLGPDERIQEIRLGDIYPSLPQMIGSVLQWSEMRMGVPELRQGNITGLPSRTPATTILSVLREGNKRFDMILSNFRMVHGEMGLRLLQNIADYYKDPMDQLRWQNFCLQALGEEDAILVLEVLNSSVSDIEESFGITVTATSALVNKEAEKQSFIGMMQIVIPMYQQLIPTAQILSSTPPGTPVHSAAAAAFTGGIELIKRLLERFDIQNPTSYLGDLEAIAAALSAQTQGVNPATAGLVMAAPAGAPPPPLAASQVGALFGL